MASTLVKAVSKTSRASDKNGFANIQLSFILLNSFYNNSTTNKLVNSQSNFLTVLHTPKLEVLKF